MAEGSVANPFKEDFLQTIVSVGWSTPGNFLVAGGYNTAKSATFGIINNKGVFKNGVVAFTNLGAVSSTWPNNKTAIQSCVCGTLDLTGSVVVGAQFQTDQNPPRILAGPLLKRYNPTFSQTYAGINTPPGGAVLSVATDRDGNFFALYAYLSSTFQSVEKFNPNGISLWKKDFTLPDRVALQFQRIAIDNDGNCYIVGSGALKKISGINGAELWVKTGIDDFGTATAVVPDITGAVYVASAGSTTSELKVTKYTSTGAQIWQQTHSEQQVLNAAVSPDAKNFFVVNAAGILKISVDTGGIIWFKDLSSVNADGSINTNPYRSVAALNSVVAVSQLLYIPAPPSVEGGPYTYNENHSVLFLSPVTGSQMLPEKLWGTYKHLVSQGSDRVIQDENNGRIFSLSRTPAFGPKP